MNVDAVEKKALWVTVAANLIMAVAGWITFEKTGSQAILLDGNFSFVLAIATLIAIFISKHKHKKTPTFPYGSYVYEAAFVMTKGLLMLGIIIMAFFQNAVKIMEFFKGEKIEPLVLVPIYYYVGFILAGTAALLLFFYRQNKKIDNKSSMLNAESKAAKVDGILTLAVGMAFFLISLIPKNNPLDFLIYIGDALLVVVMSLAVIRDPLELIKNAFVELGGGTLQNKQEKNAIEKVINTVVKDAFTFETYISKLGSAYIAVIYVTPEKHFNNLQDFISVQQDIKKRLKDNFPVIYIEIALKDRSDDK